MALMAYVYHERFFNVNIYLRISSKQHKYYCRVDLHARSMYFCIIDEKGTIVKEKKYVCCSFFAAHFLLDNSETEKYNLLPFARNSGHHHITLS